MISVFGSLVGDEEIANVTACMKSQWMGFGKNVELFEKKYQEKYRLPTFAMVDSGSNALFMAVTLLDLPRVCLSQSVVSFVSIAVRSGMPSSWPP